MLYNVIHAHLCVVFIRVLVILMGVICGIGTIYDVTLIILAGRRARPDCTSPLEGGADENTPLLGPKPSASKQQGAQQDIQFYMFLQSEIFFAVEVKITENLLSDQIKLSTTRKPTSKVHYLMFSSQTSSCLSVLQGC